MEQTKCCSKCKIEKPLQDFNKQKASLDGRGYYCRACIYEYNSNDLKNNPEKFYNKTRKISIRHSVLKSVHKRKFKDTPPISLEEYTLLLTRPCGYCGGALNETSSGIDRIDSSKGYITGNVIQCCRVCNTAKSNLSLQELASHLPRMLEGITTLLNKLNSNQQQETK